MYRRPVLFLLCLSITLSHSELFSTEKFRMYARILRDYLPNVNETGNELWHGFFRDCDKRVTFSCIQKNAYTYLDNVFIERDNITVFDGLILTKNNVTYDACPKAEDHNDVYENLADFSTKCEEKEEEAGMDGADTQNRKFPDEAVSPLEEITDALRRRTVKFLTTRNYEIQLPQFFFEGASMKISPREVDENGVLLRVDFGSQAVEQQGRIFKKIKKFIRNKLLTSFLALLLIIKLIKVKFMFIIPFLFGVGTAKKLFLKLLLFFIPAFAHIFKLCSSYYTSQSTKYHHHHHHQIAHHHHHVPVPVAIPGYYDHHRHHDNDFDGYDYTHPHIQYRKDMEELKEWGIEPYEESYGGPGQHRPVPGVITAPLSPGSTYSGSYGLSRYTSNAKPIASSYLDNPAAGAHSLAYSAYLDDMKYNVRGAAQQQTPINHPSAGTKASATSLKSAYAMFAPNTRVAHQAHRILSAVASPKSSSVATSREETDDEYYGPIIDRLEDIFEQLRIHEEPCKERLVCSMYKNPAAYSPHSNLVSNELSRDPQELEGDANTASSQKFYNYLNAARYGQEGGDCFRTYPCHINIE